LMIGHIADVHLGARLRGFEELELDVEEAFESAVKSMVEEGVDAIVVSGDLFDKPKPSNRALRAAVRVLRWAARDRGVPVLLVLGDHDYPQRGDHSPVHLVADAVGDGVYVTPERFPRGFTASEVVKASTVSVKGIHFTLLPFVRSSPERRASIVAGLLEACSRLSKSLGRPRVLVAHLGLRGYTFEEDASADPSQLPPYEYAALGHIHKRIIERIPLPGGATTLAYPSSLVPLKADEAREHLRGSRRGPILVDLSGDEVVIHELEFEQPRIQAYLEARVADSSRLVEEALRALQSAGWNGRGGKRPVLHLALELEPSSKLSPREAVALLERRLGVIVRLSKVKRIAKRLGGGSPRPGGDEVEVIRTLLDPHSRYPDASRALASIIAELKVAAAHGDLHEVERLLEEAFSEKFDPVWREATLTLGPRRGGLSRWLGGG